MSAWPGLQMHICMWTLEGGLALGNAKLCRLAVELPQ